MSWLARSIANSFRLDDGDDHDHGDNKKNVEREKGEQHPQIDSTSPPSSPGRGVKEDISELTKTLSRQFWGVASFLAPPPGSEPSPVPEDSYSSPHDPFDPAETADGEVSDSVGITGIRSDFAEIGGRFRSGISMLSNGIPLSEITKMASNFLQLGSEQENYDSVEGVVGVTEDVVAFVRDIAMHPETWMNFPLPDDEDADDFDMSDVQQEHALAVERLAPGLAALRIELCPAYMSESCFWKIYFVLLHPRLTKDAAEHLSTPEIVNARALLTLDSQKSKGTPYSGAFINKSPEEESFLAPSNAQSDSIPVEMSPVQIVQSVTADSETEKHPIISTEIQIIDKSVVEEGPMKRTNNQTLLSGSSSRALEEKYEDDGDEWLKEESSEMIGENRTTIPIENEEDVSFSDLEDDDGGDVSTTYKKVAYGSDSSTKDSRDWVQLSRTTADSSKHNNPGTTQPSESKDSNDWLDVDEIDVM